MIAAVPRQLLRFAAAGVLNTAVGLAVVFIMARGFGAGAFIANGIGLATGFIVGYQINRLWTFRSSQNVSITAPRYLVVFFIAYALNAGILAVLLRWTEWPVIVAQAASLTAYSLAFYLMCRRAVFRAGGR